MPAQNNTIEDAQTYIDPCRDLIKLEIENPDSFDDSLFSIKASHTKEGVDNVTMNFTSNDSNGLPIPQSALCTFGPSDEKEVVISAGESNAQKKTLDMTQGFFMLAAGKRYGSIMLIQLDLF